MRRAVPMLAGLSMVLLAVGSAVDAGTSVPAPAAQAEAPVTQLVAPVLAPGERLGTDVFELEVEDSFTEPSPQRFGYAEVRVAVAFRHSYPFDLPYSAVSLAGGDPWYPEVVLRDAEGGEYPIDHSRVQSFLTAGSMLVTQPPGIPARWTLAYQVPSVFARRLTAEARFQGVTVASWDLGRAGRRTAGWTAPAEAGVQSWGTPIAWSDEVTITPAGGTVLVCGDDGTSPAVAIFGMGVLVENTSGADARWPNVTYPAVAGYAVWHDGSSARYFDETHPAVDELGDPLDRISEEMVLIPPGTTLLRFMEFATARDTRFVDPAELPDHVVLTPPSGGAVWIDVAARPGADLSLPASTCTSFEAARPFDVTRG